MSEIIVSAGVHLLSTPATCYAFRRDGAGSLRHLYWGPRRTLDEVLGLPATEPPWLNGAGGDEELAAEGGLRYGAAGLRVRFADGTRGLDLEYAGSDVSGTELSVVLRDRDFPLEVCARYRIAHDCDVIERWLTLRHTGTDTPIEIVRADSACWVLPRLADYRLSHVTGGWGAENQLHRTALPHAETVMTSRRGITGHHANPWLMLDAGDAAEESGPVWSAALAWSGSWTITVSRTPADRVCVTGGFGHDVPLTTLHPGEELVTPVFAGLFTAGGFGAASRGWHHYLRARVLPRPGELRPVLYNSWEATEFDIDEAGQRALARVAASLGAELFVVDDGWFGARTHDAAGLGDWTVNRERFPGGLRPLIEEVRRLGMGFGLWVEPEMVNPESDLYRRHPDWVVHAPPRRPSLVRHQLVLDFSRDEVAAWAHAWLDRLLAEHEIDFLKWDMNRPFSEVGTPRTWLGHTRNVYAILDRLRADHPRLRVEGCASGGGRVDAGMLARVDQVWTSDNTDALDRLAIQHGHTQIYPAGTMGAWVTDSPNPLTGRSTPLRFRCHVAMAGVMALGGDLTRWTQEQLREAAGHVAAYKRIRHVVQHGLLYRLRGPNAVQYLLGDEVVVLVYAPFRNHGHEEPPLRLAGIDPDARYRDQVTGSVHHGAVLAGPGLRPDLPPGDHASTLIHLKRQ